MRLLATFLLLAAALAAQSYRPGDRFEAFSTKDQHDRAFTYEGGAKRVIVAFDEAVARGVFGAPTFFVQTPDGEEMHFGQDRLDFVEDALKRG